MPHLLSVRDLQGFRERRPIIPPTAVYIGRFNQWYGPELLKDIGMTRAEAEFEINKSFWSP
jgi:hypothetical protein